MAHICVLAFDNKGEQFKDIDKLEESMDQYLKRDDVIAALEALVQKLLKSQENLMNQIRVESK